MSLDLGSNCLTAVFSKQGLETLSPHTDTHQSKKNYVHVSNSESGLLSCVSVHCFTNMSKSEILNYLFSMSVGVGYHACSSITGSTLSCHSCARGHTVDPSGLWPTKAHFSSDITPLPLASYLLSLIGFAGLENPYKSFSIRQGHDTPAVSLSFYCIEQTG